MIREAIMSFSYFAKTPGELFPKTRSSVIRRNNLSAHVIMQNSLYQIFPLLVHLFYSLSIFFRWPGCMPAARSLFNPAVMSIKKGRSFDRPFLLFGRGERIRTSGPRVPNAVLYQTEPRPDCKQNQLLTDLKHRSEHPAQRLWRNQQCQQRRVFITYLHTSSKFFSDLILYY